MIVFEGEEYGKIMGSVFSYRFKNEQSCLIERWYEMDRQ
jgi:hypothetical protein